MSNVTQAIIKAACQGGHVHEIRIAPHMPTQHERTTAVRADADGTVYIYDSELAAADSATLRIYCALLSISPCGICGTQVNCEVQEIF